MIVVDASAMIGTLDRSAKAPCYVAVAEALHCPVLTTDTRLAGANGIRVPIIVV